MMLYYGAYSYYIQMLMPTMHVCMYVCMYVCMKVVVHPYSKQILASMHITVMYAIHTYIHTKISCYIPTVYPTDRSG